MFKIIAIVTMLIDHVGLVFFPDQIVFRLIGRLAFPFFAWGIASGYVKTRNVYKYGWRLLLLALISQLFFYLVIDKEILNICFTLLLGLAAIFFYENKLNNKFLSYFLLFIVLILPFIVPLDYGLYGIVMIMFFHIFKNKFVIPLQSGLTIIRVFLLPQSFWQIFAIPSFFIIHYFEKYDFKINKYLQYSFYPLHLLLIYLITLI